jgi:hypothetical protein
MATASLKRLKDDWWNEGKRRGIRDLLFGVVEDGKSAVTLFGLEVVGGDESLVVWSGEGGFRAYYNGNLVYSEARKLFVPGDWTNYLVSFVLPPYQQAARGELHDVSERERLIQELTCGKCC